MTSRCFRTAAFLRVHLGIEQRACKLWNLDKHLQVSPLLQHEHDLHGTVISSDGKLLVTDCGDKSAYVWDIHSILTESGLEGPLSILDVSVHIASTLCH